MSDSAANAIVFACNWDGLSSVEAAGQARLSYPASVRVVRINCLSRLNHGMILKAFELGARGVLLIGCEPGRCRFDSDAALVARELEKAKGALRLLGMREERLVMGRVPPGDGAGFVQQVTAFVAVLDKMQSASSAWLR